MTEERRFPTHYIATLPGVAAILIGFAYVVGAVVWGAELYAADVEVADAFPLIAIEQYLARGIQVLTSVEALLVYAAVLLLTVIFGSLRYPTAGRGRTAFDRWIDQRFSQRTILRALLSILGLTLVGLTIYRPIVAFAFAIEVAVLLSALAIIQPVDSQLELPAADRTRGLRSLLRRAPPPSSRGAFLFLSVTTMTVFATFIALFDPRPLPSLMLRERDGDVIEARLITANDQTWYAALEGESHAISAIPFHTVVRSRIRPTSDQDGDAIEQSLPELLQDN